MKIAILEETGKRGMENFFKNNSLKRHLEIVKSLSNRAISENALPTKAPKQAKTNVYM